MQSKKMQLNNESMTLFIPLYGKAEMSKENLFIKDEHAEWIIQNVDFDFTRLKQSKWLSMMMAARASLIDERCLMWLNNHPKSAVIHAGCGLDSRCLRINDSNHLWFDLDLSEVISLRKTLYKENEHYKMISSSVTEFSWMNEIDSSIQEVLFVMEGLTMYLHEDDIKNLVKQLSLRFNTVYLVFDAYSKKAVKMSKYKNPINQMNAKPVWGMDEPKDFLGFHPALKHHATLAIKKEEKNLSKSEQIIFERLYCGKIAQSYYKIYEFELKEMGN